jgi:DNA-binding CsgD family transcriptional regulator
MLATEWRVRRLANGAIDYDFYRAEAARLRADAKRSVCTAFGHRIVRTNPQVGRVSPSFRPSSSKHHPKPSAPMIVSGFPPNHTCVTGVGASESSQIIDDIYEATIEPMRTVGALVRVADFVRGQAAAILWRSSSTRSLQVLHHFGIKRYYANLYSSAFWKCDPTVALAAHADADRIVSIPDLVPYNQFCHGRFYREWGQPQGWIDSANVMLARCSAGYLQFSVIRHQSHGMVNDNMRSRMSFIMPHLKRLLHIQRIIEQKNAQVATLARTINHLGTALILLDVHGGVVHANTSGNALLSGGSLLHISGGKLCANDVSIEQAVQEVLQTANTRDALASSKSVALPLAEQGGERYVVRIRTLPSRTHGLSETTHSAIALVLVHKAVFEAPAASEVIARTSNLTPTEMRVLRAIVEIGGVPEVAVALGVAETTVKTHLGRIFGKTGTRHQADLVKLVSSFSIPILARSNPKTRVSP